MAKDIYSKVNTQNLEAICKKIDEQVGYEAKVILDKALKEKERALEEARLEVGRAKDKLLRELDKELEKMRQKFSSMLTMQRKRLILEEKNKLVGDILESVKQMGKGFRSSSDYAHFLEKSILEGVGIIDCNEIDIIYSFLDEDIIKEGFIKNIENLCHSRFSKNFSFQFQKGSFKDTGLIIQSMDARLIYDNRFLARFKRVYDDVCMELMREV